MPAFQSILGLLSTHSHVAKLKIFSCFWSSSSLVPSVAVDEGTMPTSKLQSLFVIPPNEAQRTFGADEDLPKLPLPDMRHTLTRYLDSLKPFNSKEEHSKSIEVVRAFEEGVGRRLHEKLKQKARSERNWVEKWWEELAYLQVRVPLLPYCSMDGVFPRNVRSWTYGAEEDQIKHAALVGYHLVEFWHLLRREKLRPSQTADKKVTFSMSQYRRLFNTVRMPGDQTDSLVSYFKTASEGDCPTNVVVMSRGRFFNMNAVDGEGTPMSPVRWEAALRKIQKMSNESRCEHSLALLTCDTRTNWSKNRRHLERLSKENERMLEVIDKSLFVLVLDEASPETDSEVTDCNLCGDYANRWSDKSTSMIFYKNGRSGAVCDHTAFDGIVVIACHHYVLTAIEETNFEWKPDRTGSAPDIEELKFEVDKTLEGEISRLKVETLQNRKEILMTRHVFEDYGKAEIQRLKFHPDSYVQMCLQLAYCSLHGKPAACYETATTRKFYNGRTETLRCCTTQCLDWVASMLDSKPTEEERKELFVKAVARHDELMNEARENAGCDRHLFGMYCTALEEGIQIPDLFLDPAYLKSGGGGNFTLSTSCTGYTPIGGGVAPMCKDGYGVFYNITPGRINFTISVNTNSGETDAGKYFSSLKNSLKRTREMLLSCGVIMSKF